MCQNGNIRHTPSLSVPLTMQAHSEHSRDAPGQDTQKVQMKRECVVPRLAVMPEG